VTCPNVVACKFARFRKTAFTETDSANQQTNSNLVKTLQRRSFYREENWRVRLDINLVRLDVVACADMAAHVRIPLLDIPLEARSSDGRGTPHWQKTNVLCKKPA
jgi:hypothetical protein